MDKKKGRPKKEEYISKHIHIPISLKEKLEKQAEKEVRDLNNLIIVALKKYLESV